MSSTRWQALLPYLVLFIMALTVRWLRLPEHLFFGFEQGRDAFAAMSIARLQDFVLVGPKTDIGGVFHGAWYYYLLAIPYGLSGGNPLVASLSLVVLGSLVPVVIAYLVATAHKSWRWGWMAGLLTVMSYEAVQYSRWLSNVTPALLLVPVTFLSLWLYKSTNQARWWLIAVAASMLAAQFEIILLLWWGWVWVVLLATKWLPIPHWKTWLMSVVVATFWFTPMILFNLRNDFISFKSSQVYLSEGKEHGSLPWPARFKGWSKQLYRLSRVNVVNTTDWRWGVVVAVALVGLALGARNKKDRQLLQLSGLWFLMTLPVMLFPRSLDLPQLYIGSGLALIVLLILGLKGWWDNGKWPQAGKVIVVVTLALIASTWFKSMHMLVTNQDVFFRTIQDDLNYADQQAVLAWIWQDAAGQDYRFKAYAIPYFQEEGWQYLHRYKYGPPPAATAQIMYLVVEKPVEAYWVKKWAEEVGPTTLLETKQFGLIQVEKRGL